MLHVFPHCFNHQWIFNSKLDDYDFMLLYPAKIVTENTSRAYQLQMTHNKLAQSKSRMTVRFMSPAECKHRVETFRQKLVQIVGVFHNKFLDDHGFPGSSFIKEFAKSWHYKFNLEKLNTNQIPLAELSQKPKKVSVNEIRKGNLDSLLQEKKNSEVYKIEEQIKLIKQQGLNKFHDNVFNDFEKRKFEFNDNASFQGTGAASNAAVCSQNYIKKTLKWKKELSMIQSKSHPSFKTKQESHYVEDKSLHLESNAQVKYETLLTNIQTLVNIYF